MRSPKERPWSAVACYRRVWAKLASPLEFGHFRSSATLCIRAEGLAEGRPGRKAGIDSRLRTSAEGAAHRSVGPSALKFIATANHALTGVATHFRAFGPGR